MGEQIMSNTQFSVYNIARILENRQKAIYEELDDISDHVIRTHISKILSVLRVDEELESAMLAHYTSPAVSEKLLGIGENETPQPLRLCLADYTNDPMEGTILLDYFNIFPQEVVDRVQIDKKRTFIACFTRKTNNLDQFRLYGKDENIEGSGVCLVLKNEFFREKNSSCHIYQVAYIHLFRDDDDEKQIKLPKINGENPKDFCKVRKEALRKAVHELSKYIKQNTDKLYEILPALEYIRYLFKDGCYKGEKEFRILNKAHLSTAKYCDITGKIYLEYKSISHYLDHIILGSNYSKTTKQYQPERLMCKLYQKEYLLGVDVYQSKLPINP